VITRSVLLCAILLTGCAAHPPAEVAPPAEVDRPDATTAQVVSRVAQRYLDETPLVGLSVAVARDGRIVHESGYGLARRAPDLAADATVPFELFSIAKPVTAVLLLRLAERGLVDLDQASGTYVQGLPPEYASATLRQLLRHSSGVAEIVIDERDPDLQYAHAPSRDDVLAWLATGKRSAAPDETWIYASSGYVASRIAAEAVTQRPLGELIRDDMALPLALGNFASCSDLREHSLSYVAASGTTPFTLAALREAKRLGALSIGTSSTAPWGAGRPIRSPSITTNASSEPNASIVSERWRAPPNVSMTPVAPLLNSRKSV